MIMLLLNILLVLQIADTSLGVKVRDDIIVETDKGPVLGQVVESWDPRYNQTIVYQQFLNIPYALPPVGQLRFRPPKPTERWIDPVNNNSVPENRVCFQTGGFFPAYDDHSEDCLYLKVYVPQMQSTRTQTRDSLLPVMVYIHGGGWLFGGAPEYGPDFLMIHEIVLVIMNYRLGPFGSLTLGIPEAPGNLGLRDQLAALEWVQRNIEAFGGDPNQVTLSGQSAGSYSTFYQAASPKSRGLFHRIIGQSGVGGLSPGYHQYTPEQAVRYGREAAFFLGCLQIQAEDILDCLTEKDSLVFLSLVDFAVGEMDQPVVDGEFTDDPFLPEYPELAFENGDYDTSLDILLGVNSHEGLIVTQLFYAGSPYLDFFMAQYELIGPMLLFQLKSLEVTEEDVALAWDVLEHYTGRRENITMENVPAMTDMFSDTFFWFGVYRFIDMHLDQSSGNTYQYINKYINDDLQFIWSGLDHLPGVCHSDELALEFSPIHSYENKNKTEADIHMSALLTTAWTNFVKTGYPAPYWNPVQRDNWEYLSLNSEPKMEMAENYFERMEYWKNVTKILANRHSRKI